MANDVIGLINGKFVDTNSGINTDQENIFYVGKHGSDTNDGKTIDRAVLTFTKAITLTTAGDTIQCVDNGTYTENLTCKDSVNINAPNATLVGAHTLADSHQFNFYALTIGNSTTGLTKAGTGPAFIKIRQVAVGTNATFLSLSGATCVVYADIDSAILDKNSTFYYTTGSTPTLYLKFNKIILGQIGTGCKLADLSNGGNFNGIGNNLIDFFAGTMVYGSPVSTTFFALTVNALVMDYLSNINASISAQLFANIAAGSLSNLGAGKVDIQPYGTGLANGICPLDASANVPIANLPPGIFGGMTPKGLWDCSSGAYPVAPTQWDWYICSKAGTISGTVYTVGDYLIYNGSTWDKVDMSNSFVLTDQTSPQTLTGTYTFPQIQDSGLTSGRVTYAGASGLLSDSANLTFNGTTLTIGTTLGLASGSITDTTGAISFGNENLTTTGDITGRDLTATRDVLAMDDVIALQDGYFSGDVYIGYGYGSAGGLGYAAVIAHDGSSYWQGIANFTAAGIRILEDAIATPTSAGAKGELTYGTSTYDYLYTAIADSTWRKVMLTQSGGERYLYEAATGTVSLAVSDMNKFLSNSAAATYTLPAYNASGMLAGDKLTLYVGNANYFRITLSGSDTARYISTTTAAGGYFRSNTLGSKLTLINTGTSEWIITDLQGTWTYDS